MKFVLTKKEGNIVKKVVLEEWKVHPHPYICFYDYNLSIYYMIFIIIPTLLLLKFRSLFAKKTAYFLTQYKFNLSRISNLAQLFITIF